jgi:hypothetical protein
MVNTQDTHFTPSREGWHDLAQGIDAAAVGAAGAAGAAGVASTAGIASVEVGVKQDLAPRIALEHLLD